MIYKPHTDHAIDIVSNDYSWDIAETYRPKHANPVIKTFAQAKRVTKRSNIHLHGRSTDLHLHLESAAICYHWTDIVTHFANGYTIISNGGYYTSTTKAKINEYAPYGIRVYQKNYQWFIVNTYTGQEMEFRGRIEVNPFGIMSNL